MNFKDFKFSYFLKKLDEYLRKRYSVSLKSRISQKDFGLIMSYIEKFIGQKSGDGIIVDNNKLTFRGIPFKFGFISNIFIFVEKGEIKIIEEEQESILVYDFLLRRTSLIIIILNILFLILILFTPVFSSENVVPMWFRFVFVIIGTYLFVSSWQNTLNDNIRMLYEISDGIDKLVDKNKKSSEQTELSSE